MGVVTETLSPVELATAKITARAIAGAKCALSTMRWSYRERLAEARAVFARADESLTRAKYEPAYAAYVLRGSTA